MEAELRLEDAVAAAAWPQKMAQELAVKGTRPA
jgi:hypothetical protein